MSSETSFVPLRVCYTQWKNGLVRSGQVSKQVYDLSRMTAHFALRLRHALFNAGFTIHFWTVSSMKILLRDRLV